MCFSPQRRTILRHQNFQKWSRTRSFLTFYFRMCFSPQRRAIFDVTSAPAALTDLLLDWPDTRIYEKTQHFVTSLTFGADVSSFLLTFWLLHLLSTDLTTPLLLFNSPYCRKFLFKLPSTIFTFSLGGFLDLQTSYKQSIRATKKKHLGYFPWNTGCLIGILFMVYHQSPHNWGI